MAFLGYRYHEGDGSRVILSAITPSAPPHAAARPLLRAAPGPRPRVAAGTMLVTASHVRMVLGRDRVRGRESTGRSFTPGFQDRSRPIPSTYARKHAIDAENGPGFPGPFPCDEQRCQKSMSPPPGAA